MRMSRGVAVAAVVLVCGTAGMRWVSAQAAQGAPPAQPAQAPAGGGYADRLYVLNGGVGHAGNARSWLNMMVPDGTPIDIAANSHLIKHGNDWMMFDTSTNDIIATMPNGFGTAANAIRWTKTQEQTIEPQLKAIGITPADVKYIGISHNHADHTGNVYKFKNATVLIQRREFEQMLPGGRTAAGGPPNFRGEFFERNHPVSLLDGDYDVFGDGSVILFYVGGHTLGSQVCLVRLRNTGYVLLSGDAVHLRSNWDTWRIPRIENADDENHWIERVQLAFERVGRIVSNYKAQLWIHHDMDDYKGRKFAPQYYD